MQNSSVNIAGSSEPRRSLVFGAEVAMVWIAASSCWSDWFGFSFWDSCEDGFLDSKSFP